jgi:hypothetical protein
VSSLAVIIGKSALSVKRGTQTPMRQKHTRATARLDTPLSNAQRQHVSSLNAFIRIEWPDHHNKPTPQSALTPILHYCFDKVKSACYHRA